MSLKLKTKLKKIDDPFTDDEGPIPSRPVRSEVLSSENLHTKYVGLKKVISGFQRGVDIGGIKAARKYGIETGGAMPLGFLTLDGMRPEYRKWGAKEVPMGSKLNEYDSVASRSYRSRTEANVKESDGTLRIAYDWRSPGELCTARYLNQYGKSVFNVDVKDCLDTEKKGMIVYNIVEWLRREKIRVLNVAGNADAELEGFVIGLLSEVFERMGYERKP